MRTFVLACAALVLARPEATVAQACRAVRHPQLEALLPTLPGFSRQMPHGETDDQEAVARTTVDYEEQSGKAGTISVELTDSCRNPYMLAQVREFLKTGPPPTRGTVFRSVPVSGFPSFEEWTAESQHTEIHILVADRFMVKVTGGGVDVQPVRNAAQAIDLQRLATLR
jgi:hypothetical protein